MLRFLVVALPALLLTFEPGYGQQQTESEEAAERYHITPETTHLTGPLDENGKLDFYAAVNQRQSEGVTRDNNAARFILGTLPEGYPEWTAEELEALHEKIDFDRLPMDYPRLVHINTFAEDHAEPELVNRFWDHYALPMDPDEFPLVSMFVELNSPALDAIVEASTLTRFYVPLQGVDLDENDPVMDLPAAFNQTLISSDLHHVGEVRNIARLLTARAMLRIGKAEYAAAWSDVLAVRRLGRLVGSGATLIEGLVGVALADLACKAARELMLHAAANDVPDQQPDWQTLAESWGEAFRTSHIARQFDFAERLMYIELITLIADDRITITDAMQVAPISSDGSHQALFDAINDAMSQVNEMGEIDWNAGLRWANTFYDRLVANAGIADPAERNEAQRKLVRKMRQLEDSIVPAGLLKLGSDTATAEERAQVICGLYLSILGPTAGQVQHAEGRTQSYQKIVALALASLQYRTDNGRLPGEMSELADQFESEAVFHDSVTGKELVMENTPTGFVLIYQCQLSQSLNFEIELPQGE